MLSKSELAQRLRDWPASRLFDELLASDTAFYFESEFPNDHKEKYREFCDSVGKLIGVSGSDVVLIGSARVGFSLNPKKHLSPFNEMTSDFDIAIISPTAFDQLWSEYLESHYSRTSGRTFESEQYSIFRKFATTDSLVGKDPRRDAWERRLGPIRRTITDNFYFDSSIRFRFYQTHNALRQYHTDGLNYLQGTLRSAP